MPKSILCWLNLAADFSKLPANSVGALASLLLFLFIPLAANADITSLTLESPQVAQNGTTSLLSPIHVQATAEDTSTVTGYVVYVDNQNVYQNSRPSVDAWIVISSGNHTLSITASDAKSNASTAIYSINVSGFAPPIPPTQSDHLLAIDNGKFTIDNAPGVGGLCNHGSLGTFSSNSDPNTGNLPSFDGRGQHFVVTSGCTYDDSLFYRKFESPTRFNGYTNFLWDFWFYIPTTTKTSSIQALEFDVFQAVPFSDGVHEFVFGTQCNYVTNHWQFWLPQGSNLTWVDTGISPCQFTTGVWHHSTYFLQRVTPSGYQQIPNTFSSSTDTNTSLRFGTLTIDGQTTYLGGVAWSTIPNPAWTAVLGVQHQLDSAVSGIVIDEYLDQSSLLSW